MHHSRMDAAVAVDAQTAPTATWKTAQDAVSHIAHTHYRLLRETRETTAPHTKTLTVPPCLAALTRRAPRGASRLSSPFASVSPFLRVKVFSALSVSSLRLC